MGVRYGSLLPLFFLGVLPLARVGVTCVYAAFVGLTCAMPFMVTLAWLTWREFDHPAPATRREPRAGEPHPPRDPSAPRSEEEEEEEEGENDVGDATAPVRTVAVIGGGAAGLAALRQMLAHGMDAVLFERTDDVGGLWDYASPERSKVFRNVLQNVTKTHNRFAGHHPPKDWPIYLGHEHTLRYLKSFAEKFGLMDRVRLRSEVTSCVETANKRFELVIETEDTQPATQKTSPRAEKRSRSIRAAQSAAATTTIPSIVRVSRTEVFDAVCVCTGQLAEPSVPDDLNFTSFTGAVVHSSEYRDPRDLAEARVLVVGTGAASGSDIAQDACALAESVTVSVRTHRWMIHRGLTQGAPTLLARTCSAMPAWFGSLLALYADWIPFFFTPGMTDSRDFLNAVALGRITLKPTIAEVNGSTVTFTDGTSKDFDAIVLATGFKRAVPFIHHALRPTHRGLYKGTLHPRRPRVAYVLFVMPFGSHFQCAELQASWIAKVWSGICPTPSIEDMERHADPFDVDASHAKLGEHFRMRYLVLMFREMFPLVEWARAGQWARAWRALWARYADPIGEWDPASAEGGGRGNEGHYLRAKMAPIVWRNIKFI